MDNINLLGKCVWFDSWLYMCLEVECTSQWLIYHLFPLLLDDFPRLGELRGQQLAF